MQSATVIILSHASSFRITVVYWSDTINSLDMKIVRIKKIVNTPSEDIKDVTIRRVVRPIKGMDYFIHRVYSVEIDENFQAGDEPLSIRAHDRGRTPTLTGLFGIVEIDRDTYPNDFDWVKSTLYHIHKTDGGISESRYYFNVNNKRLNPPAN